MTPTDNSEADTFACNDSSDNDGDGLVDASDPGCTSPADEDEHDEVPLPQCSNGFDDDGDGLTDSLADPGCKSPADTNEADCRGAQGDTVTPGYTARVELAGAPDAHLMTFDTVVAYCYDGAIAEVLHATTIGTVDPGVDLALLNTLGFDIEFVSSPNDVVWSGSRADLSGEFEMTFDVINAIDRVGLTGMAREKLTHRMERKIAKALKRYGYNDQLTYAVTDVAAVTQFRVVELFEKYLKKLDRVLPDELAAVVRGHVLGQIDAMLARWREQITVTFSAEQLAGMTSEQIAGSAFDSLLTELREPLLFHLSLWSPHVVVEVYPDGSTTVSEIGQANPLLTIEQT